MVSLSTTKSLGTFTLVVLLFAALTLSSSSATDSLLKKRTASKGTDDDIASQIVDIFTDLTNQENGDGNPWLRQAHAKQHGCVQAYVTPLPNLPSRLAQGVFANATTYPAFIRFSNGVGRGFTPLLHANESDLVPDIRGMAIKLLNVSGPFLAPNAATQVFTLTTGRQAFLDTAEHALSFFSAVHSGNLALTGWLALHPRLAILYAAQAVVIADLLTQNWYSPAPQQHGQEVVKHHFYPCDNSDVTRRNLKGERAGYDFNYLKEQLQEDLSSSSACFRWAVQFYQDEDSTPIDDTTVRWDSPFEDIAVIKIPPQDSWNPNQDAFCRYMSFNPGSTIAAHAPVGPIPTIRDAVYAAMATLRHSLHGQPNRDVTYQDWLNYPNL